MDTITLKGLTFSVSVEHDKSLGAPWDEHDGHGPVRTAKGFRDHGRYPVKRPGERVLDVSRHGAAWLYDWQEAMRLAKRDGWGLHDADKAALAKRLGREPTPGDIRREAVQRDFDFCRRWLEGDWHWVGVVVTLLDTHGEPTRETESVWGVESDATEYLQELARENAASIAARIGRRKYLETKVRVRK